MKSFEKSDTKLILVGKDVRDIASECVDLENDAAIIYTWGNC
jgi:hypothetical protein